MVLMGQIRDTARSKRFNLDRNKKIQPDNKWLNLQCIIGAPGGIRTPDTRLRRPDMVMRVNPMQGQHFL